jgi:hypothetical protein
MMENKSMQSKNRKIILAGDSWALKAYTNHNYITSNQQLYPEPGDIRLADFWDVDYKCCFAPGEGNLKILDRIKTLVANDNKIPIVWLFAEPGRDYGKLTGDYEFHWIESEDIFNIRNNLMEQILKLIRESIPNPVALIGAASDVDKDLAEKIGFTVLCSSWQYWIAKKLNRTKHFKFGFGASDIGWRADYNNVKPSRAALFAWDDLIKEWCMWDELGFMCHEHPTPLAHKLFGEDTKQDVLNWIDSVKK